MNNNFFFINIHKLSKNKENVIQTKYLDHKSIIGPFNERNQNVDRYFSPESILDVQNFIRLKFIN